MRRSRGVLIPDARGFSPKTVEEWKNRTMRSQVLSRRLWLVVFMDGQSAGVTVVELRIIDDAGWLGECY